MFGKMTPVQTARRLCRIQHFLTDRMIKFLGAFAQSPISPIIIVALSPIRSTLTSATHAERMYVTSDIGDFMKICPKILNFVNIWQKYQALEDLIVFCCCRRH